MSKSDKKTEKDPSIDKGGNFDTPQKDAPKGGSWFWSSLYWLFTVPAFALRKVLQATYRLLRWIVARVIVRPGRRWARNSGKLMGRLYALANIILAGIIWLTLFTAFSDGGIESLVGLWGGSVF